MQAPPASPPDCRILLIGPGGAGKSTLTIRYLKDVFVEEWDPTSS